MSKVMVGFEYTVLVKYPSENVYQMYGRWKMERDDYVKE